MKSRDKLFKNNLNSKIDFVIIPFGHVPFHGKPMRYQNQWWVRKSYYNAVPWIDRKLSESECKKGIIMHIDDLVVIIKSDLSKNYLGSILNEFSQNI